MSGESLLDANFYRRCLAHLAEVRETDFVVQQSLPIPYFGDLKGYLESPLRVLTAALNPSCLEFPKDQPRFDVARGLRGPVELETELCAYFCRNPYKSWFSAFEPVLNGLEASYGGNMKGQGHTSIALHVDMCSPIATKPKWSALDATQRGKLTTTGRDIFEWLADELKPHVIVASLGWAHLQEWNPEFREGRRWERIVEHSADAKGNPLRSLLLVQIGSVSFRKERPLVFVNASAHFKPFGKFTTERKLAAGKKLLDRLRSAQ